MASSPIEICNMALTMLGKAPIANFEENTETARTCNILWPTSRDAILRMHPWNCAIARKQLAKLEEPPVDDYTAAFVLPVDLLRLLSVKSIKDYRIEGRTLLCNASSITIRYIYRNEDIRTYDALLVEVLTYYLASKLAYPVTKSNTTQETMLTMLKGIMPSARNVDAQEEPTEDFEESRLITVRG